MRRSLFLLILLASLFLPPATSAAPGAASVQYVPIIAVRAELPQALPDGVIRIALPFTILDSCPLNSLLRGDKVLVTVCRVDSGAELNGGWQLEIDLVNRTAMPRMQAYSSGEDETVAPAAVGRVSTTRLGQITGPDGRVILFWIESTTGRSRTICFMPVDW